MFPFDDVIMAMATGITYMSTGMSYGITNTDDSLWSSHSEDDLPSTHAQTVVIYAGF